MRLLVIGCGSIGLRRARILAEMGHEIWAYDPDIGANVAFVRHVPAGRAWASMNHCLSHRPDAVFVCTTAETHLDVAWKVLRANDPRALFVEKPLSLTMEGVPELVEEAERRGVVTMGACNMRWAYPNVDLRRPSTGDTDFVIYKPLSQWRPGAEEAYRSHGIVLEMAIHEMDLAVACYGLIVGAVAVGDGTDERCLITLTHESGAASNIDADWGACHPQAVCRHVVAGDYIEPDSSDEPYRLEMEHFLSCVERGEPTRNPLRSAMHVLEWAIKAQEQIRQGVTA